MSIQMRLTPNDSRMYSPNRDLAYCGGFIIERALQGLDPAKQEPWIRSLLENAKITDEQLIEAGNRMADYVNNRMADPQYKQPVEAMTAAGIFELPEAILQALCAKMGQIFLSAYFVSLRDVTKDPNEPPVDKAAICAAATDLENSLSHQRRGFWTPWF